jgi:hypothetical protein
MEMIMLQKILLQELALKIKEVKNIHQIEQKVNLLEKLKQQLNQNL